MTRTTAQADTTAQLEAPAAARLALRESVAVSDATSEVGHIVGSASQRHWQQFLEALAEEDDVNLVPRQVRPRGTDGWLAPTRNAIAR